LDGTIHTSGQGGVGPTKLEKRGAGGKKRGRRELKRSWQQRHCPTKKEKRDSYQGVSLGWVEAKCKIPARLGCEGSFKSNKGKSWGVTRDSSKQALGKEIVQGGKSDQKKSGSSAEGEDCRQVRIGLGGGTDGTE